MPVLSELLQNCEVKGSVYFCDYLTSPWTMNFYKRGFHYLSEGHCELIDHDGQVHSVHGGDVIVVLREGDHIVHNPHPRAEKNLLICGYFSFRNDVSQLLFKNFPSLFVLRAEEVNNDLWLKASFDFLLSEARNSSPGGELIVNKLTEVLLVQVIRQYAHTHLPDHSFARALYDRHIGKALELMHGHPEQDWTLEKLAKEVGVSRASFAKRFKDLVGVGMFAYLTDIRITRAKHLLEKTDLPIYSIAESVGYASDVAFSRAFKKATGLSIPQYRKNAG